MFFGRKHDKMKTTVDFLLDLNCAEFRNENWIMFPYSFAKENFMKHSSEESIYSQPTTNYEYFRTRFERKTFTICKNI